MKITDDKQKRPRLSRGDLHRKHLLEFQETQQCVMAPTSLCIAYSSVIRSNNRIMVLIHALTTELICVMVFWSKDGRMLVLDLDDYLMKNYEKYSWHLYKSS